MTASARALPSAARTALHSTTATTVAPAPVTTIAPVNPQLPTPPSTVPLTTKAQSAHVNPLLAYLSGAGFLLALLIMAATFIRTRPGRRLPGPDTEPGPDTTSPTGAHRRSTSPTGRDVRPDRGASP